MWHAKTGEATLLELGADERRGLTNAAVSERHETYGPNAVSKARAVSGWVRFIQQFHNPLIYMLLAAAAVTLVLGEYVDSAVIFAVTLVNAVVGFIQEHRAEEALAALDRMIVAECTVIREGKKIRIEARNVTVGDTVLLASGDKVPADLRLVQVKDLQVDESILTGESVPSQKEADALAENTVLADRTNMAYGGTLVTYGTATGIVTAIGDATETGKIAALLKQTVSLKTPLMKKIEVFSRWLLLVILAFSALTFFIGVVRGYSATEMFMASVALAVGAIPEGLPAAMTIMLAIGVTVMARRNAIIRTLPSVETLGSTTVICSDKTGTLTENQMTVQRLYTHGAIYEVSGLGYDEGGVITLHGEKAHGAALQELLTAGILCNDSNLATDGETGKSVVRGDPTEGALLVAAHKLGLEESAVEGVNPRLDTLPFESDRQYMATLHESPSGRVLYVKGSIERLLPLCRFHREEERRAVMDQAADFSAAGLRVLAFAMRPEQDDRIGAIGLESLEFVGLQAMIDPPRESAKKAVAVCKEAGIRVKMITGDHALTAKTIAMRLGITDEGGAVITGEQLGRMDEGEVAAAVRYCDVYARVAPEQKLRLVEALQAQGEVVSMTGDGVNDAPALKRADIGVAMGITGTDVSKEAANMVLADDNFTSIVAAVEEGRIMFANLIKFIIWTLPTNLGEGLIIFTAILFGFSLPMLPVQVLWVNMTTAVLLGLMLAFEPKESQLMRQKPRNPKRPIVSGPILVRMGLVGTLMLGFALGLFFLELARGQSEAYARTVAVTVFVMIETAYLFNCRSLSRPIFGMALFSNPYVFYGVVGMIGLQLLFIYAPFMQYLFQTESLSLLSWVNILIAALLSFAVVEFEKKVYSGKHAL